MMLLRTSNMKARPVKTPVPSWIRQFQNCQILEIQTPQDHLRNLRPRHFRFRPEILLLYLPPTPSPKAPIKMACCNAPDAASHLERLLNSGVTKRYAIQVSSYINALTAEKDSQSAEISLATFDLGMSSLHRIDIFVLSMDVNMLLTASSTDSTGWTMLKDISRGATITKVLQYSE